MGPRQHIRCPGLTLTLHSRPPPCPRSQRHSSGHPAEGLEGKLGGFGLQHDAVKERAAREELKDNEEREHRRRLLELEEKKLAVEKEKMEREREQRERHHQAEMEQRERHHETELKEKLEQRERHHQEAMQAAVDANALHRYIGDGIKVVADAKVAARRG